MKAKLLLIGTIVVSASMSACLWDDCGGGGTPTGGFAVRTADVWIPNCPPGENPMACVTKTIFPIRIPHPGVYVSGSQVCDLGAPGCVGNIYYNSYGSVYHFGESSAGDPAAITFGASGQWANYTVQNGRVNALWNSSVAEWSASAFFGTPPCQNTSANAQFQVTLYNPYIDWECGQIAGEGPIGPFPRDAMLVGSLPSNITFSNPRLALTTSSGMPGLRVYDENGADTAMETTANTADCGLVVQPPPPNPPQIIATSVSPDGTSASFPFPTLSNGSPLPSGFYGFNVWNQSSPGKFVDSGAGFFAIGQPDTSKTTPFGVDAANVTVSSLNCVVVAGRIYCSSGSSTTPYPILTLSSPGQVTFKGGSVGVGSQPVAVKGYAVTTFTTSLSNGGWVKTTEPSRAIVANFGSNTVSIVDLYNYVVVQTVSVGTQPAAIVLNQSKAYVANYGSSSVSEIDLTSNTQTRVAAVGTRPEALAMDPGGNAVWVGGLNFISKLDLGTFTVTQNFSVSGQVTSLVVSAGYNRILYTTIASSSGSTTFQAQQLAPATGAVEMSYAQQTLPSSSPYAQAIVYGGPAPGAPGWLMPGGALVSANYSNGVVVVGTPTGYAVVDLGRQLDLLDGATPNPVRGIATVPGQGIVYLTVPDSNLVMSFPLPKQRTFAQGTVTIGGTEQTVRFDPCASSGHGSCPQTAPDSGTISVMVADAQVSTTYGNGDTAATVAGRLAQQIGSVGFPVRVYVSTNTLTLFATQAGAGPNQWPIQVSCQSNFAQYGISCSFWASPSASTLSGGN